MGHDNVESSEFESFEEALKEAIFEGFIEVPMLPKVASHALQMAQDPESSASELATLIQRDQAIAGHVMRIANSAAYAPKANLVTLQQAIARLGMNVITEIVLTAVIGAKLFRTPGYEDYVEHNWEHALATSLWAKEIARQCRGNVEVCFFVGLLHSIGKPGVLQTILDMASQRDISISPEQVQQLESKYYQAVTELVLTRWNMPSQVIEAIKPYDSLDSSYTASKVAATVNVAAHFASYMLDIAADDNTETLIHLPALGILNLNQDSAERLLALEDVIQDRLDGMTV